MPRDIDNKRQYEKDYYHSKNKEKKIAYSTRWRKLKKYGLTQDDYDKLVEQQNNCCKICNISASETHKGLHVDHCHTTNKVRGLLCYKCNTGLGQFNDDPSLLQKAKEYLIV